MLKDAFMMVMTQIRETDSEPIIMINRNVKYNKKQGLRENIE